MNFIKTFLNKTIFKKPKEPEGVLVGDVCWITKKVGCDKFSIGTQGTVIRILTRKTTSLSYVIYVQGEGEYIYPRDRFTLIPPKGYLK
jgi:hypothetical protein